MWPEAPEGVLVGAYLPEVDAQAIQVVHAPELPALYQRPQALHGRVKEEQVARQNGDPAVGGRPRDTLRVALAQGERFLHETRLARFDALQGDPRVGGRGRRNDHRVRAAQQVGDVARDVRRRVLPRQSLAHFGVEIAHRGQLPLRQARDGADMVAAPRARADHAELEPTHR